VVDIETVLVSCPSTVNNMFYTGTFLANNCSNMTTDSHFGPQGSIAGWFNFSYGTPHRHFLLAKWGMGMLKGLSLRPTTHILLIDVPSAHSRDSQLHHWRKLNPQARVVLNPFSHITTKNKSFCFIVISFSLQNVNFERKEL